MDYSIYSSQWEKQWDEFIDENSINGTFLHTRRFFDHNPANQQDDHSFVFSKKGKIVAVVPAILYQKDGKKIFHSHLRSTYGGVIVGSSVGMDDAVEIIAILVRHLKEELVNEIIIRNPFRIFYKNIADEIDYAMWYHGFVIKSREIETAIHLGDYENVQKNYDDSTRRSIRKSEKSLVTTMTTDYKAYWNVLEANLLKKYNLRPTHDYDSFMNLLDKVGEEKIKVFVALKDAQVAAGIVVFLTNKKAIHAQYIASDESFQEFRPLNAVIDHIVQWGCKQGYTYFNLGTSNADSGKTINSGLFRFKEGFGGRGVLRETMHLIVN